MTGSPEGRRSGPPLPVDEVLGDLRAALRESPIAILVAPPGAGKTTGVPLALLDEAWLAGRSLRLLEPRRLAARAAAERMADLCGEAVGGTVGYRVRLEGRTSSRTRIEVVTEGVFRRQVLDDPELDGVGAVLFDEFHERSVDADFTLALVRDVRAGLRPDLRLVIMSATLDTAALAGALGDVPVIESRGRLHPVRTRYAPRPFETTFEDHVADTICATLAEEPGDVLCFLPGRREIERTAERLQGRLPAAVALHRLSGSLDRALQDAALGPAPPGMRKLVLSTAVAETSLTIPGVRIVIDGGLARLPRFDAASRMTRLVTVPAALSAIEQRRGRAGRTGPGLCIRLWSEARNGALPPRPDPEIRQADLAGLVLDMAAWGVTAPDGLPWLDPPPRPAWSEAVALLQDMGALAADGTITRAGRRLLDLPLHPRLAHMVVRARDLGRSPHLAAEIAAILSEPGVAGRAVDLGERLRAFRANRSPAARTLARQSAAWAERAGAAVAEQDRTDEDGLGPVLALAYPDRIAGARSRDGTFKLANGKGCRLDPGEPLSREPFLVVAEVTGSGPDGRIVLAAPISAADLRTGFPGLIGQAAEKRFDPARARVVSERVTRLGALVLDRDVRPAGPGPETVGVLLARLRQTGFKALPADVGVDDLCARLRFLASARPGTAPLLAPEALLASVDVWLAPFLAGATRWADITPAVVGDALAMHLGGDAILALDRYAPVGVRLPSGRVAAVDYGRDGGPGIAARPHDLFGPGAHPAIDDGRYPLAVTLLSPADRPIQVTGDLPGFWAGSWREVRAELKSRYPKHDWPADPAAAAPSRHSARRVRRPD